MCASHRRSLQFSAVAEDVFPKEYEEFLSYASFVNIDIGIILSYSCIFSPNFHGRLLLVTITPLVVLLMLLYGYQYVRLRYMYYPQRLLTARNRHLSVVVFVVFFVYSSVSSVIFQTFPCEAIDGDVSLKADHSVSCTSEVHAMYRTYASVMIGIYPIGVPVFFALWLYSNRKSLRMSDRENNVHLQPFSSVWMTYRPSRYYFELVEYCRRLSLSMSSALLIPNSVDHIAVVLSLALAFLFVSESLAPFENSMDRSLYRWGNGVVISSMYIALLMKAKTSDGEYGIFSVFGWLLIAANVVMIIVVVVETVVLGRGWKASVTRVQQLGEPVRRPALYFQGIKRIHPIPTTLRGK